MKIALLQCNSVNGDVAGNLARVQNAVRQAAQEGVDLCVTPELALCGVTPGHFLQLGGFSAACLKSLDMLAASLQDGPALLVGVPVPSVYANGLLSNVAALVQKGGWQVVSRKAYRNQELSWDAQAGLDCGDEDARFFDRGFSCGIVTVNGWRLGVVLCEQSLNEDGSFWNVGHGGSALVELLRRGVDALVHMAASPFWQGSQESRERLLSQVAARQHMHIFSVNMVGGNDCRVYNGQSCVFDPTGQLLARGKAVEEDVLGVNTASEQGGSRVERLCACAEEDCWHALVLGTRDFVRKCGGQKAIVALSGGMDSALVACVAVEALGSEHVTGVLMPSPYSSPGSLSDAARLAANLGMATVTLPIEDIMRVYATTLAPGFALFAERPGDVTLENIQSRIRGTLVMALANRAGALVLNTGNKSECAVGYCTLYGDTVGALGVIGDVTKTQVYALGHWYNAHIGGIPEEIFVKAPSAELRPGQKDEDSLPPYAVLDPVLEELMRPSAASRPKVKSADLLRQDIQDRLLRSEFKRRQLPPVLMVSPSPFGTAWRTPVAGVFRLPKGQGDEA